MRLKKNSSSQKIRGAYYTPQTLADAIVRSFCISNLDEVLEPSCGDGVFIDALARQDKLREVSGLTVIDTDKDALDKVIERYGKLDSFKPLHQDFFDYLRNCKANHFSLIIGNPPYIRYQYLEPHQRELLSSILTSNGMKSNKLINAWVGFMVASTALLKDGGTLAFVIPAEILQVVYAEDLRLYLATHFSEITLLSFKKLVFDEIEQEILVFVGKKGAGDSNIRIVQLNDIEDCSDLNLDSVDFQPLSKVHEKWTKYFLDADDAATLAKLRDDSRLVKFGSSALVNVGVTTGNNKFFSLDDATSKKYRLDGYTLPLIGRSSHASGVFFTSKDWIANRQKGKLARLLVLKDGQYNQLDDVQRSYIDSGFASGESNGYKCSIRNSWYSVPSVWIPDAFFLRRNNLYPKFVLNDCGAISTDTMHRIKFRAGVNPKLAILSYYNSIGFAFTELCGRSYGGGVLEILPKEVSDMLVPDLSNISLSPDEIDIFVKEIDQVLRQGRSIEIALDLIDKEVLQKKAGFSRTECLSCRNIWKTLQARRLGRA